jgi:hypothetical protein
MVFKILLLFILLQDKNVFHLFTHLCYLNGELWLENLIDSNAP